MNKSILGFLDFVGYHISLRIGGLGTLNVEFGFLPLIDRNVVSSVVANVVLSWSNDLVFWIIQELTPVGQPSNASWDHEQHWEHVSWEAHCFVNYTAVEIHVGIQLSLNEVWVIQGDLLQFDSNFNKFLSSSDFKHFVSDLLDNFCSWIV